MGYSASTPLLATPVVQTTTLTGTQNDFALNANVTMLRCNNATALTLTGFVAGIPGQVLTVLSVGAGQVNLSHQAGGSSAANRLLNFVSSAPSSLAAGVGTCIYQYDGVTARWRLLSHQQGDWIQQPFNAGDFVAATAGTWTVQAGDLSTFMFYLRERTLDVVAYIDTTTIVRSGASPVSLLVTVPGGYSVNTAKKVQFLGVGFDNGVAATLFSRINGGVSTATQIEIARADVAQWQNATDNTFVRVTGSYPIA